MNEMVEKEDKEVENDSDFEIEVTDDTPPADRGRERRAEGSSPDIPDDDEVKQYSENVQKRLKHLKWEYHEERRAKEEAERIRDQAVAFASRQHSEVARLRKALSEGEQTHMDVGKRAAEARLSSARMALRAANETGDSDAIAKAQEELAMAVTEASSWSAYRPQYRVEKDDPTLRPLDQNAFRPQVQKPNVTSVDLDWAERNPWFQKDERMTAYAFAVHSDLIKKEGIAPGTEQYYKKIDEEMQKRFPESFTGDAPRQGKPAQKPGTVVAAVSRTPGTPRKITLTASQVAVAKRLGLTPKQYAAEMLRLETEK